jgi:hypothetical protein
MGNLPDKDVQLALTALVKFGAICKFLRGLKTKKDFDKAFSCNKTSGWYESIKLWQKIPEFKKHKMILKFLDRKTHGYDHREAETDLPTSTGLIKLIFVVSYNKEETPTKQGYNNWFRKNIYKIFAKQAETFVHEYTHDHDFRLIKDDSYFDNDNGLLEIANKIKRTQKKMNFLLDKLQIPQNLAKYEELRIQINQLNNEEYTLYLNDPIELNAYFIENVTRILLILNNTKSVSQQQNVIGKDAHEFIDKFFLYLQEDVKRNITQKNKQKFIKRASKIFEQLKDKKHGPTTICCK